MQDLREIAGISRASIAKLGKNENVTTEVLDKVCRALQCDIGDIAEIKITPQDVALVDTESEHEVFRLNSFFAGIGGFDAIDLNILCDTLIDRRSGIDFTPYVVQKVPY